MKVMRWIGGLLALALLFCGGCDGRRTPASSSAPVPSEDVWTDEPDDLSSQLPPAELGELPQPEQIKLYPLGENYFSFGKPSYRLVYYTLPEYVWDLLEQGANRESLGGETLLGWCASHCLPRGEEPGTMYMLDYLRVCGVPKEAFVQAVAEEKARLIRLGCDIYAEEFELPNPDIIYTFDDAVVNAYYARGEQPPQPLQPVEPDGPLPVYEPGDIALGSSLPELYDIYYPHPQTYRNSYYGVSSTKAYDLIDLLVGEDHPRWAGWQASHFGESQLFLEENEMGMVSFIKYFSIGKEEFTRALETYRAAEIRAGREAELYTEDGELPNPDLLYTFDNQKINAYYLRR